MKLKLQALLVGALFSTLSAATTFAAPKSSSDKRTQRLPIALDGALTVDNPVGNVEVIGTADRDMEVSTVWTIRGVDDDAVKEGKRQTQVLIGGNLSSRVVRTIISDSLNKRWSISANYTIRVPRSIHVNITSHSGESIKVTNISGNLNVKNVNGSIYLYAILGRTSVDTINGNIYANYHLRPTTNAVFSSVNGQVEVRAPRDSALIWQAETLRGDILSTVGLTGRFERRQSGTRFVGSMNGGSSPVLHTATMMGSAYLLGTDVPTALAASVLPTKPPQGRPPNQDVGALLRRISSTLLVQPPTASTFVAQRNVIDGDFQFQTTMGNVFMGEVRGSADITTRAGEIVLGRVLGRCSVISLGGPINLGDIHGDLVARTAAGDVNVRAARKGGVLATEGGNIQLIYAGEPVTLHSGGGDITLHQASARVKADTKSGDINITVDPRSRTETIEAQTVGGNVSLNLPRGFAADLDITVLTSTNNAERIHSEFGTLSIIKEQVGNRTRIRGIGKINGGGERIQISVDEGDVHIKSQAVRQVIATPARQ